ncbi:MAG: HAD family hydrolase [Phycisphaerales bacterium]|nr:HAD family hydrolase [Phycisphaerales bacterium]
MTILRNIRAVVFDIGGTLLDFDQPETLAQLSDGINAGYEHLDQAGVKLPSLRRYSAVLRRKALLSLVVAKLRRREPDTMKLLREGHARMGIALDGHALTALGRVVYSPTKALAHANPQTPAALATLRDRGYQLAIVSNTVAPPPGLDEHLADEGLLSYFPIRVYSCVFGVAKPNPRIFRDVLEKLNVSPEDAVYIGDKPAIDIRGAQRVDMRTVLRAPKGASNVRPRADAIIREIPELLNLLPPLDS